MVSTPRGVRDFSPSEAIALNRILDTIEEVFKRFGFYPIVTPAIENLDVLSAKAYGEESTKEIYKIADEDAGLRYDLTVPLARYVAMNKDIPLPLKRYQIDRVWRLDEPQHMRSREFIQADVDVVGSTNILSDAEVIAANAIAIEEVGISDYKIHINSRILLNGILAMFGIAENKRMQVIRVIDKLSKLDKGDIYKQLGAYGLDAKKAEDMINFITEKLGNDEKLQKLENNLGTLKEEIVRLGRLLDALANYKLSGEVIVDFSLARGLDYYTGFVWEFVAMEDGKRLPTIAGGGRYDNLLSLYTKKSIPAVGSSIGISRLFEIADADEKPKTYARVFVATVDKNNVGYAINVANRLRSEGLYADLNIMDRSITKQLEYANSLKVRYVAICGEREEAVNKVRLRNMTDGKEQMLTINDLIDRLKE